MLATRKNVIMILHNGFSYFSVACVTEDSVTALTWIYETNQLIARIN